MIAPIFAYKSHMKLAPSLSKYSVSTYGVMAVDDGKDLLVNDYKVLG